MRRKIKILKAPIRVVPKPLSNDRTLQRSHPKQQLCPLIPTKEAQPPVKKSITSARVTGFNFPLSCEEDVDRLELMVNRNPIIKNQYIKYLSVNKPPSMDVVQVLYRFFDDDALSNFSIQEKADASSKRKPISKYTIFNLCMLEAWSSHGVTRASLTNSLKEALLLQSRRRYSSCHRRKQHLRLKAEK